MKLFRADDFKDILINATWPIVQLQKAADIANRKTLLLIFYIFLLGICCGSFFTTFLIR